MSKEYTKLGKYKLTWEGLLRNSEKPEKQERIKEYWKVFYDCLHDEIKARSKHKEIPEEDSFLIFIEKNKVLPTLVSLILKSKPHKGLFIEYSACFLRLLKYNESLMKDEKLNKEIFKVILNLSQELDNQGKDFLYKIEYTVFLNCVTRLILNYPKLIKYYKIKKVNPFTHKEYEEYLIFSSLMNLLEIDHLIKTFEHRKYIRRSLIVHLSFDLFINSSYFQNKATFVEILVNKLCNFYQMLPTKFDFEKSTRTLEAGCNIHLNFHVLCPLYFEFTDYITFLNKITNCFTNENIKIKLRHYFFNKFLIQNVQPLLLSDDPKISRTHFQYLVSFLHIMKNATLEDVIIDFLFGFSESKIARKFNDNDKKEKVKEKEEKKENENNGDLYVDKTEEFDYSNHKASEISLRIFNNMRQKREHANVVIFKLFEILFEKRPYLMIKKFVKPYSDFVIKRAKDKSKYLSNNKSYPITLQLLELLNFYQKYDTTNMANNAEASMFKNFAYYINYDIDFYTYYSKQEDERILDNKEQNQEKELEKSEDKISNNACNTFSVDTLMEEVQDFKKNKNDKTLDENVLKLLKNDDKIISIDNNLLKDNASVDEGILNMNFLFMKNLHEKLMNFFNNDNLENIFLVNLLITIISVPCLNFDPDLVKSTAVMLDENSESKYSFLTIFRHLSQIILDKVKNDEKKIEQLKKFIQIIFEKSENKKDKKKQEEKKEEEDEEESEEEDFLIFLLKKDNKDKMETTNIIIFCEFIKEYICSISHKHKFEGLIENLYGLYCEELNEFSNYEE